MATSSRYVGDYGVRRDRLYSDLYILTRLPSANTPLLIRLHCATKSSLWYMGYVPRGSALERPRIYRTSTSVHLYIDEWAFQGTAAGYIHVSHVPQ